MNSTKKLKVGIIVDDINQPYLVYDLYQKSLESNYYSVECLIIQKTNNLKNKNLLNKLIDYSKSKGVFRLIDRIMFEFVDQIETLILRKKKRFKDFFLKHPISKFEVKKICVNPDISKSGLYYHYKTEDLDQVKNLNLDLLIRGGSGILQGDILNLCPLGIISFHHGDNDFYRGGPPGFWEVYNREPSTGFVIQRLTKVLDGGDIIFKGHVPTSFFYKLNVCKLFLKSSIFLHKTLENLSNDIDNQRHYPKKSEVNKINKIPRLYQSFLYLLKTLALGSKKILNKLSGWSFRWNVCYQFVNDWRYPIIKNSTIIKNPHNRFLADPFTINYNNRKIIFVEDYDFSVSKGKISAYEITLEGHKEIGVALEEKFHLSYPFLFESDEGLFMVPETHEAKDIRIYKCDEFPLKWKLHKILIKNIRAVDTNIFKYNNKYWLFTNLDSSNLGDYSSELHIFYADNLDATLWKPHSLNPVIFDSKKARNAGMIYSEENQLYRVFQKHDFDMYGASLGISQIKSLTENNYEEEILIKILPDFFKNILGIHTFSFNSGILVNDFVKNEKIN
jgi:methionyl-tRNA formyltransferase